MRETFQEQLDDLQRSLLAEADLALGMLRRAVAALKHDDVDSAHAVIDADDEVDNLYLQIRQQIEAVLARQTPVAIDLRLVLAMLDINVHLERMADYCVTIAKLTKLTENLEADAEVLASFEEMAQQAVAMTEVAMRSFAERDQEQAESLVEMDESINRANRRLVTRLLDLGADPARREWGLRMILVSRCIERFGDHAVDIGEQTAYLVTGEFREFTDASRSDEAATQR